MENRNEIKIKGLPKITKKINKNEIFEEELSKYLKELLQEKPKKK